MNADSTPRYAEPSFDDLTPEQVMQNCAHCAACIGIIERFTGDDFKASDKEWHHMATLAGCQDCMEYE